MTSHHRAITPHRSEIISSPSRDHFSPRAVVIGLTLFALAMTSEGGNVRPSARRSADPALSALVREDDGKVDKGVRDERTRDQTAHSLEPCGERYPDKCAVLPVFHPR